MMATATTAAERISAQNAPGGRGSNLYKRFSCRGYWREAVLTRAALVECQLDAYKGHYGICVPDKAYQTFQDLLGEACAAAGRGRLRLGNRSHHAFLNLHAAEVLAAQYIPAPEVHVHIKRVRALLETTLKPEDPRRELLTLAVEAGQHDGDSGDSGGNAGAQPTDCPSVLSSVISEAYRVSYSEQDEQYARVRSFRNTLLWCLAGLVIFSAALAVMGWLNPKTIPLCFDKPGPAGRACPLGTEFSQWDATLVEFLGSVGGTLAAVFAIRRLQGTTTPYGVSLSLALLKLPLGAITALVGLLFIQGEFVPGLTALDASGQILAYAVVLGYAQQVVTHLVDRQGAQVLEAVPSKSEPIPPKATSDDGQRDPDWASGRLR